MFLWGCLITGAPPQLCAQNNPQVNVGYQESFQEQNPLYLVNIGDADLTVRYKKGEGTPVIFVHGSWDDHHSWMQVAESLHRYINNPIILYDRRGHSASSPDIGQGSVSQDMSDLVLLTLQLGFEKAHFIGHSYGANILVRLASAHSEIVESIVLYEPPLFGLLKSNPAYTTEMKRVKEAMNTAKNLLEDGAIEKGTKHFIEKVAFGKNSWETIFDERARSTMLASYRTWLDQANDPERLNIRTEGLNSFLGNITLITGTHSIPVYSFVVKELKDKINKTQVKEIKGAGHGGLATHVDETLEIIIEHLQK